MDLLPSDTKKKDPDSFSLDPDGPDLLESVDIIKRPQQIEVDFNLGPVLSSIIASPKLPSPKHHKIDSFSQEDTKQAPKQPNCSDFPLPMQLSLSLCKAFSRETKVVKKMKSFINTMNENLRLTEQLVKTQENRIDEFFQEVYDLFISNFQTTTELYKQNLKNKLKQEFDDYCLTHELMKSNMESIMANDSFPKILQQELFTFASHNNPLNNANLNGGAEGENKGDMENQFIQFVNNSIDLKLGLTPLVKKFKLIEYSIQSRIEKPLISQNLSQNASEIRKEPLKDFADIYSELENFVSRVSSNFSHEISSILHPHAPFISTVEKISRNTAKILPFPFDPTAKNASQWDLEEVATRKRLSQIVSQIVEPPKQEGEEEESEKDKEAEKEKELLRSPPLSSRSISGETGRAPPSLTPVKNVTYKVPIKENSFTADAGWFGSEDMGEIAYQTQLISVHNHLSVGDLISVNSVPYRILHKEWIFPEDIVQMCNIFTGEIIEVKYHSRHSGMEDQIITKKLEVIGINTKKGYYLLMEPNWDKSDTCRRLPNIIEMKDVLDKGLEEDIKENFNSDKKVIVHVLRIKEKDIIVSYRKEWL